MNDVTIIGAGAAGLMAAIFSARYGAKTLLLEKTSNGGRKILISGGSRCNILPAKLDVERFVTSSSPNILRKMVRSWPLEKQIAFFEEEIGIALAEEEATGKLFPESNRSSDVHAGLVREARLAGAEIRFDTNVTGIEENGGDWRVLIANDEPIATRKIIISTGGLSVAQTGSDGRGLAFLRKLGHTVHPTYAALTPLLVEPHPFQSLAGVSLDLQIEARTGGLFAESEGGFLFTHRGYSGPALLDISHVAVRSIEEGGPPAIITVNWCRRSPDELDDVLTRPGAGSVFESVRSNMPERLAECLMNECEIPRSRKRADLRRGDRKNVIKNLTRFTLPWTGHAGYKKAEVTGGGVALSEVQPKTLESRRNRGLYLCGELLDAFGPIGGYNFLWAWATGRAAGISAAESK